MKNKILKSSHIEALPARPKKTYQCPRLRTFGRMHSLVAGGAGSTQEGMAMTAAMRYP